MVNMLRSFSILIFLAIFSSVSAQTIEQPKHKKVFYTNTEGVLYAPTTFPIYLHVSNSPTASPQGILLKDQNTQRVQEMFLSEGKNTICNTTAVSTPNGTKHIKQCYDIIADGTAPTSASLFSNAPTYKRNDTLYYGQNLSVSVTSTDAAAGVQTTWISVNNARYLPSDSVQWSFTNGKYDLLYYATDNVGNTAKVQHRMFIVDIASPRTKLHVEGTHTTNILAKAASITLTSTDNSAGVKQIFYSIDKNKEQVYKESIVLKKLSGGMHTIRFYAKDQVENIEPIQEWTFFYDTKKPEVQLTVTGDTFPDDKTIFVSENHQIQIAANDNKSEIRSIDFVLNTDSVKRYTQAFKLPNRRGLHRIVYTATDQVDNKSSERFSNVYLDTEAPSTYFKPTNQSFWSTDTLVLLKNTGLRLISSDLEAGVKEIRYTINGKEEQVYQDTLFFEEDGLYEFTYYAKDKVLNTEKAQSLWIRANNSLLKMADSGAKKHKKQWIMSAEHGLTGSVKHDFFLRISTSPKEGAKSYLVHINKDKEASAKQPEALQFTRDGKNAVRLKLATEKQNLPLSTDGVAPKTKLRYSGAQKHVRKSTKYFGLGQRMHLSATDAAGKINTGVEKVFYSINGATFAEYTHELDVFKREQKYVVRYYAIDSVHNIERMHKDSFIVDVTAPVSVPVFEKANYVNIFSAQSKLSFTATDNLAGVHRIYYAFDKEEPKVFTRTIGAEVFKKMQPGAHVLHYYAEDKVGNRERKQFFPLIIDHTPPNVDIHVAGNQHTKGQQIFVAPGGNITLSATEKKTEIANVKYSINGGTYKDYKGTIALPKRAGAYTIHYLSTDKVDNVNKKSQRIFVDNAPPNASVQFQGPMFKQGDLRYISKKTKVKITASDNASGVNRILYSVGGARTYTQPFSISGNGQRKISFYAIDMVNNKAKAKTETVFVDNTSPSLDITFRPIVTKTEGKKQVIYSNTLIYVKSVDKGVGLSGIFYTINGGEEQVYRKPISGLEKGKEIELKIIAKDRVGNQVVKTMNFLVK